MNRTRGRTEQCRLVAWIAVLTATGLLCGSVAAAGWQAGTGATAGLGVDTTTELQPNDGSAASRGIGIEGADEGIASGSDDRGTGIESVSIGADPTVAEPAERDGGTNENCDTDVTDGSAGRNEPDESNETGEAGERRGSNDTGGIESEPTSAESPGSGTDEDRTNATVDEADHTEPRESTEPTERKNASTGTDGGCSENETERRTDSRPSTAGERNAEERSEDTERREGSDHSALRSGLWIVGILSGLTTLFSFAGFVAAVLAYRGTD